MCVVRCGWVCDERYGRVCGVDSGSVNSGWMYGVVRCVVSVVRCGL